MSGYSVDATEDPRQALAAAGEFLTANPVEHNLVLTLVHDRISEPLAGRYWWARDGDGVAGFVLQSPRTFKATITPMAGPVVAGLVEAVAGDVPDLPGVVGNATTAAHFAGAWSDRRAVAADPAEGGRLYRLNHAALEPNAPGALRSVYRRIGYEPISEILSYRFGSA
jgi:hypothetical protein